MAGGHLLAQQNPFNLIFSSPTRSRNGTSSSDFSPLFPSLFLSAAVFIGHACSSRARRSSARSIGRRSSRATASCRPLVLAGMFLFPPENLLDHPARRLVSPAACAGFCGSAAGAVFGPPAPPLGDPRAAASSSSCPGGEPHARSRCRRSKGISYARNFLDEELVYRSNSPFGDIQVYSSTYLHFALASPRQRRLQHPADAGQRLPRHVHRRRRPDRHHARPAGRRDRLFPLSCRTTTRSSSRRNPGDVRRPVRRRASRPPSHCGAARPR